MHEKVIPLVVPVDSRTVPLPSSIGQSAEDRYYAQLAAGSTIGPGPTIARPVIIGPPMTPPRENGKTE